MDLLVIASRVAEPDMVKVWVDEDSGLFKVEYAGQTHSAIMPADPDEGEPQDVHGDIHILMAATHAWNGEPYFEMPADEFSEKSGGYWAPHKGSREAAQLSKFLKQEEDSLVGAFKALLGKLKKVHSNLQQHNSPEVGEFSQIVERWNEMFQEVYGSFDDFEFIDF